MMIASNFLTENLKGVRLTRHPRHDASDIICDSEEVGHCGGVEKLVLFKTERKDRCVTTASISFT